MQQHQPVGNRPLDVLGSAEQACRLSGKPGDGAHLVVGQDGIRRMARDRPLKDFAASTHAPGVGVGQPSHEHITVTMHRTHDRDAPTPRHGIGAERDACRLRRHHLLQDDSRRTWCETKSMLAAIGDNSIAVGRAPHCEHAIENISGRDVQKALELTGEGTHVTILVARRRSHREKLAVRTESAKSGLYGRTDQAAQRHDLDDARDG